MRVVPVVAGFGALDGRGLGVEHQLIELALRLGEAAVDREGAGHVGGIAVVFAAGVDQQQLAVLQAGVVFGVVEDAAVLAAAEDRRVGRLAAVAAKAVEDFGLDLVLVHAGLTGLHGADVGLAGDLRRLAHQPHLGARLEQPQFVQDVLQVDELVRHGGAGADALAQLVDPAHQLVVELRILAHRVVDAVAVLQQAGEDLVDVADREGVVGVVVVDRAILTGAAAVPGLLLLIAFAAEEDVFALLAPRHEHGHRFRLREVGQVEEVAVLTVGIGDIAVAGAFLRRRDDGDGILFHHAHQRAAAPPQFGLGQLLQGHGRVNAVVGARRGSAAALPEPSARPCAGIPAVPCRATRPLRRKRPPRNTRCWPASGSPG